MSKHMGQSESRWVRWRVQVGVDLNRVAQNSWQAAPLQFLAGLGPRKAQALIRAVQREQHVLTRHDVWEELRLLGRTVFRCYVKDLGFKLQTLLSRPHPSPCTSMLCARCFCCRVHLHGAGSQACCMLLAVVL